ncbi:dienelactone hydrolase family protein [Cohnella thermotolerans]|uniref:dienelactone hydrolase family protein n=1 Tax=Cohnella thermotolerans TaxID=329858 RepID=UPI0003FBAFE6|nr:alpha/beta hydrolase family protein [Cohnella thermotolerans]
MRRGDSYLDKLYEEAAGQRAARNAAAGPAERKGRLLEQLKASLGAFERVGRIRSVPLERVEFPDYVRERVELSVVAGLSFGAYVLLPKKPGGRRPGVIAVHGHGYGSRQICGMLADGTPDPGDTDIYRHFAVQLVRRGMAVIAPDMIGFGERMLQADLDDNPQSPNSCYRLSTQLLMMGKTLTGLRVTEMLGALDYFARREEVDPQRIGIVGFSGGALISCLVSALDERIEAAALIGFPNTFKDSVMSVHHCICNYTPGILEIAELPELIGLIAPRPLFLESGDRDPIFPAEGFRKAVEEIRSIYRAEGAEERFDSDLFPGGHEVSGRKSFDWLKRTLGR